jgi:glycosyltransferase involved in cell wall biosynthesis
MRVLRVLDSLDPATGGPPSVFSAAVISSAAAGTTIECLTFRPSGAEIEDFPDHQRLVANGIKVHAVRDLFSACLLVYRRSRNFDIIHVDGCWEPISIIAVLIAKLTGRCSAVTPHETLTFEERRRTRSRPRALAKRLLSYYYIKLADCIIYSSALEERDSPRHRNSVVIPHPVYEDTTSAAPVAIRNGFAALPRIQLGYLGRFHFKKNLEHIVMASLQTPGVRLLLAGGGPDAYERTLRALDHGNGNLSWLGFVQKEQREKFFREIDFLVLASEYECFGMAAAEAMVRGIPVIVTERVGVTDDVKRTGGGLVVAVGVEPLVKAFKQCADLTLDQYAELQDNALKAAVQYSYSAHGHSQVLAYRRTLETQRSA